VSSEGFARLHDDARRTLAGWHHREPAQEVVRDAYLDFLDAHPDAMSRACRVGHLTASALVLDADRTRVLLTLHPKVGRWLQLGGHCEVHDASLRAAALRETIEEGGIADVTLSAAPIRLDRHAVTCAGGVSEHLDVQYLGIVPTDAVAVMSDESDDLRWFPLDGLPPGLDAVVVAMIADAMVTGT
jgi:8-oxo-dGTP pyrophosphatase MutT (NUDIX family)